MDIRAATKSYHAWLSKQVSIVEADLELKLDEMARTPFGFLRATFYRWMQLLPQVCPEVCDAPSLLAVGDLHVENFGSWRDSEGRLVWGVNDFDEVDELPYTNDLVRLATSACLMAEVAEWSISPKSICRAILEGYGEGLESGGVPFVLGEDHRWFTPMVMKGLRDPVKFWGRMRALPRVHANRVPEEARAGIIAMLPDPVIRRRFARRTAGLGSLGRPRFVGMIEWRGAMVAREAKARTPSATAWAKGEAKPVLARSAELYERAVRCPDPFLRAEGAWIVRRLAADCGKIELATLSRVRDEANQLHAMGFETANVHLASAEARDRIRRDLASRPPKWLRAAAARMLEATLVDWNAWRPGRRRFLASEG
jgi:hypothetical protein